MNLKRLIRKIEEEDVQFIQDKVTVQYDQSQEIPLGFKWRDEHYEVLKLLYKFESMENNPQYIVLTSKGMFCLSFEEPAGEKTSRGRWLLKYKVNGEYQANQGGGSLYSNLTPLFKREDSKNTSSSFSLLPIELANVAHYHGHVCPELAVGYRAAILAREEMGFERKNSAKQFVLAENMSSGIEAVQLITGCTIGNQNFFAYDLGKQVYYFGIAGDDYLPVDVMRLSLINEAIILDTDSNIDLLIAEGRAEQYELEEYNDAIANAVHTILDLSDEELFKKTTVSLYPPRFLGRTNYSKCSICDEIVDLKKSVPGSKGLYCQACAKKQKNK